MQVIRQPNVYDAVIVGSGAAGGMTALVLCRAGAKVLLLEAGANFDTAKDSKMFMWPYEAPLRGGPTPKHPFGYFDASYGGWTVEGEPYTTAPGEEFLWWRSRMLGGRTNHWGRISLRMGPYDFKPRSRDGLGFDWPDGVVDAHGEEIEPVWSSGLRRWYWSYSKRRLWEMNHFGRPRTLRQWM